MQGSWGTIGNAIEGIPISRSFPAAQRSSALVGQRWHSTLVLEAESMHLIKPPGGAQAHPLALGTGGSVSCATC